MMRDKEITSLCEKMTWHLVALWYLHRSEGWVVVVVLWPWHCVVAVALACRGIIQCDGGGDWVAEVWWWW